MSTTTTTRHEAIIDTMIAKFHSEWTKAQRVLEAKQELARRYPNRTARDNRGNIRTVQEEITEAQANLKQAEEALDTAEEHYTGWNRFFIVAGGHIHNTMACYSCNKGRNATRFGWLPALSGLTEAEAVAEHGAILCTVCFPSAPVEWTNHYEVKAAAAAAAKCSGSGSYLNRDLPHRTGYRYGNSATCGDCGATVALTSTNKLRAHKPAA